MHIAILTFASLLLLTSGAAAQGRLAFCVQGGPEGDVVRCNYTSMAQCRADVSGKGGMCIRNPAFARASVGSRRWR